MLNFIQKSQWAYFKYGKPFAFICYAKGKITRTSQTKHVIYSSIDETTDSFGTLQRISQALG